MSISQTFEKNKQCTDCGYSLADDEQICSTCGSYSWEFSNSPADNQNPENSSKIQETKTSIEVFIPKGGVFRRESYTEKGAVSEADMRDRAAAKFPGAKMGECRTHEVLTAEYVAEQDWM